MKKTVILSAVGLAYGGLLSAQGLYNIMPFDDEPTDSLPLSWTVAANVGWDSNPTPTFSECSGSDSDESMYISGSVQGNYANKTPQTTIDLWARIGATYFLDTVKQTYSGPGNNSVETDDDYFWQAGGGLNIVHRVNERLRLRSRNFGSYEAEPDYDYGLATDRRQGNYFIWSSDNSVGYRWTERFGTNTGYRFSGVTFDDVDGEDYIRHLFYNQFRYRTSETTVLTASYRYQYQDNDSAKDSNSQYFLIGIERELSPTNVIVVRAGGQFFDPDGGDTSWSPYLEATLRSQWTERFSTRSFFRYGIEDRNRLVYVTDCRDLKPSGKGAQRAYFDTRQVWRSGSQGSYALSDRVSLFGGVNTILTHYDDLDKKRSSAGVSGDADERLFNVNIGAAVRIYENISATCSLNYTNSDADASVYEYDRSRVQLGVQATF